MPAKPLKTTPFGRVLSASACLSETTPFCPPKPRFCRVLKSRVVQFFGQPGEGVLAPLELVARTPHPA
ncbi:Uncharacterized protein TCM_010519 [Theobroma cacao]|uniref:Uncharacterized protein n=1 Tax=Theobroma cacao TaxID=3641 RepID=A0A061E6P6_THECC|nr:Uncharacterized protein TCM_010519 [Theobroma cacao]